MNDSDLSFLRGYMCAVANLVRNDGVCIAAKELMIGYGCEFDLNLIEPSDANLILRLKEYK
jgi:hypothetical protein